MRGLMLMGAVMTVAGCAMQPPAAPVVSWEYGAGNGDGVAYPGPAPQFSRAYGLGSGEGVSSGQTATTSYGYGAEGMERAMVQIAPKQPNQQMAAPSPSPARPGDHI